MANTRDCPTLRITAVERVVVDVPFTPRCQQWNTREIWQWRISEVIRVTTDMRVCRDERCSRQAAKPAKVDRRDSPGSVSPPPRPRLRPCSAVLRSAI